MREDLDFLNKEYHDDQKPEPVLRCDSCQELLLRTTLHKIGSCTNCGNKRVRNVTIFNENERDQMLEWGLKDFVSEFSEVADA